MRSNFLESQVYAFLTVVLWSTAFVFTKVSLDYFSPGALGLIRCAVASLCLAFVVFAKRLPLPSKKDMPLFVLSGAAGFSLYIIIFNIGSSLLNATTSCVVIATAPIISAVMARAFFKERLNAAQWLATGMAFCGILVMMLWDGVFYLSKGILWMLAGALLMGTYNVLQRHLGKQYGALQITAYTFFPGTILLLIFLPESIAEMRAAPPFHIGLVCFLGVFPSAVAYLLWGKALSVAPKTSMVTNYMFLTPFLALLLEFAVTGTWPGASTFSGGAVILLSLLLFSLAKGKTGPAAPRSKVPDDAA